MGTWLPQLAPNKPGSQTTQELAVSTNPPLPQLLLYCQPCFRESLSSYFTAKCTNSSGGPPYSNPHATNSRCNSTESCRVPVLDTTRLKIINQYADGGRSLTHESHTHHYIRIWIENIVLSFVITTGSATLRFSLTSQKTQTEYTPIYRKTNNLVDGTETTVFERKLWMVGTATQSTRDTNHNSENGRSTDTTKKKNNFLYQEFKYEATANFYSVPAEVKRWIQSARSKSAWVVGIAIQTKDVKFDTLRALIFMNSI